MNGGMMDAIDVVKAAANTTGVPLSSIGRKMGNSDNFVAKTAGRGSTPRADTLARMLAVCGYSLCAVPSDQVTSDMLVIMPREG